MAYTTRSLVRSFVAVKAVVKVFLYFHLFHNMLQTQLTGKIELII